jgi:hypothetical protein
MAAHFKLENVTRYSFGDRWQFGIESEVRERAGEPAGSFWYWVGGQLVCNTDVEEFLAIAFSVVLGVVTDGSGGDIPWSGSTMTPQGKATAAFYNSGWTTSTFPTISSILIQLLPGYSQAAIQSSIPPPGLRTGDAFGGQQRSQLLRGDLAPHSSDSENGMAYLPSRDAARTPKCPARVVAWGARTPEFESRRLNRPSSASSALKPETIRAGTASETLTAC